MEFERFTPKSMDARQQPVKKAVLPTIKVDPEFEGVWNSEQLLDRANAKQNEFFTNPPLQHPAISFLVHIHQSLTDPMSAYKFMEEDPFFSMYIKLRTGAKDVVLLPPSFNLKRSGLSEVQGYETIDKIRELDYSVVGTHKFEGETDVKYKYLETRRSVFAGTNEDSVLASITQLNTFLSGQSATLDFRELFGTLDDSEFYPLIEQWNKYKAEFAPRPSRNSARNVIARKYLAILSVLGLDRGNGVSSAPAAKDSSKFKPEYEFEQGYPITNVKEVGQIIAQGLKITRVNVVINKGTRTKPKLVEETVLRVKGKASYDWPDNSEITLSTGQLLGKSSKRTRPGCIEDVQIETTSKNVSEQPLDRKAKRVRLGDPKSGFWGGNKTPGVYNPVCRKCPLFDELMCPRIDFQKEIPEINRLQAIQLVRAIDAKILDLQKHFSWVIVSD